MQRLHIENDRDSFLANEIRANDKTEDVSDANPPEVDQSLVEAFGERLYGLYVQRFDPHGKVSWEDREFHEIQDQLYKWCWEHGGEGPIHPTRADGIMWEIFPESDAKLEKPIGLITVLVKAGSPRSVFRQYAGALAGVGLEGQGPGSVISWQGSAESRPTGR